MKADGLVRIAMLGALLTGCAAEDSDLAELRIGLSGGSSSTGGASFGDSGGAGATGTGGESSSTGEPGPSCPSCGGGPGSCPGGDPMPPECTPIWGTTPGAGQALWCHEDNKIDIPGWMCEIGVDPMLPAGLCDDIEDECNGLPTIDERVRCAAEKIDEGLGGVDDTPGEGAVCKNHGAALDDCLGQMGIPVDWATSPGHLWNHVPVDDDGDGIVDRILIVDSYNGIYMECPPSVIPLPGPMP